MMRALTIMTAAMMLTGCIPFSRSPTVTYKDRNRDGRVDYERHAPNGRGADAVGWAFYDDDFDGYYDRKREFRELMSKVDRVHVPVPPSQYGDASRSPQPSRPPRES